MREWSRWIKSMLSLDKSRWWVGNKLEITYFKLKNCVCTQVMGMMWWELSLSLIREFFFLFPFMIIAIMSININQIALFYNFAEASECDTLHMTMTTSEKNSWYFHTKLFHFHSQRVPQASPSPRALPFPLSPPCWREWKCEHMENWKRLEPACCTR